MAIYIVYPRLSKNHSQLVQYFTIGYNAQLHAKNFCMFLYHWNKTILNIYIAIAIGSYKTLFTFIHYTRTCNNIQLNIWELITSCVTHG